MNITKNSINQEVESKTMKPMKQSKELKNIYLKNEFHDDLKVFTPPFIQF